MINEDRVLLKNRTGSRALRNSLFQSNNHTVERIVLLFSETLSGHIVPLHNMDDPLPEVGISKIFDQIDSKMYFGDALVAAFIEQFIPGAEMFVSWGSKHFKNLKIPAVTPINF